MMRKISCLLAVLLLCLSLFACQQNEKESEKTKTPAPEDEVLGDAFVPEETKTVWLIERETAPNGTVIDYTYDEHGRVTQEIAQNTYGEEEYSFVNTYNADGNLIRRILKNVDHPDGMRTLYSYDESGRLIEMTSEMGERETYRYDEQGRLAEECGYLDGGEQCAWRTVSEYNADGSRTEVFSQYKKDGEIEYICTEKYDVNGRLSSRVREYPLKGEQKQTAFERKFDELGRVLTSVEVDESGSAVYQFGYAYDAEGRVCELKTIYGELTITETYQYDGNGNLESIVIENSATNSLQKRSFQYKSVELPLADANKVVSNENVPKLP